MTGRHLLAGALLACAAAGAAAAGCAPRNAGSAQAAPASPVASDTTRLTGRLAITGSEPATTLTLVSEASAPIALVGPLAAELRRLSGAVVAVAGRRQGEGPMAALVVDRYDLEAIDGRRPFVGELALRGGVLWLDGADTLRLDGAPDAIRTQPGARIWALGQRAGDAITVESYGLIRPARVP